MLCSERNSKRDIENHLSSYHLSGARKIEKNDLLAGLVNSWTPKASGIAWWVVGRGQKDLQTPSPFGKEKKT